MNRPLIRQAALVLGLALGVVLGLAPLPATAQDKTADRAARRQQMQLMQLQQQLQETESAKARAETEKQDLAKKLEGTQREVPRVQGALRRTSQELKAAQAEGATLKARVAELEHQLAEQAEAGKAALAGKDRELADAKAAQQKLQAQSQAHSEEQAAQTAECSAKNERLVKLGAELLGRWRNKGMAEVLKQREPILGLGDVEMFNLVQDYRDKIDAERYAPAAPH